MDRSVRKGVALIAVVLIAILAMLLVPRQAKKKIHPPNDDPWVLVSYDPDNKFGTYLGNGFISTRIMGDGVGSQNGKPLPCFMAGLYDDEKLVPVPTWSDLQFWSDDGSDRFQLIDDEGYKQTLDMRAGVLTTYGTWRLSKHSPTLKGRIDVFVSRANPSIGVIRATITPDRDLTVGAMSAITNSSSALTLSREYGEGEASFRTKQSALNLGVAADISVEPRHRDILTGWITEDRKWKKAGHLVFSAKAGRPFTVTRCVALATGATPDAAHADAVAVLKEARRDVTSLITAHKAAWAKLWQKDIIIDGPKKDQQALHSCMFYLLQSVREGSQWSIPPMGLSDNIFSGHVFWDADTWMFPALILQHPELARSIVDYRFNTLPGAMANAKASGYAGAEYAWESGYTGKEDTPPGLVYRNERHINGDVALAQWQYFLATGDLNWLKTRGYPVLKATADYWVSRVVLANGRYEIRQVVPPDENAELVNNSAYTNAIAKMNLEFASRAAKLTGQPANPKWGSVAAKLYIPYDARAKRFIAHDGYKGLKAKQADTELLVYPLQFSMSGQDMTGIYKNTFDYYSARVLPKGPAMSTSAHSVIAARLKNCDAAYTNFVNSYKPYLRGPFNYFNETPSEFRESYCFLTGAAGPIQATIFGLAGAHMDYFSANPVTTELTFAPCLPKQWKSLKITGVQWHGRSFDVKVGPGNKVEVGR